MIDTKELRRLAQAATSGEWYVERGNHIYGRNEVTDGEEVWYPVIAYTDDDEVNVNFEANAAFIAAANPAAISEILDRLEAAEKEIAMKERVIDALGSELNAAANERDDVAQQLVQSEIGKREISEAHNAVTRRLSALADENAALIDDMNLLRNNNMALRAKIEAMEKQVPICRAEDLRHAEILLPSLGLMPEDKLYALPGAQPAPSVLEGWPTEEMTTAFARVFNVRDQKNTFGPAFRAALAAAPEAKQ